MGEAGERGNALARARRVLDDDGVRRVPGLAEQRPDAIEMAADLDQCGGGRGSS